MTSQTKIKRGPFQKTIIRKIDLSQKGRTKNQKWGNTWSNGNGVKKCGEKKISKRTDELEKGGIGGLFGR